MKQYTNAIIFGIAIVASSIFLGKAYTDRSKADGEIRVTGLGKTDLLSLSHKRPGQLPPRPAFEMRPYVEALRP